VKLNYLIREKKYVSKCVEAVLDKIYLAV